MSLVIFCFLFFLFIMFQLKVRSGTVRRGDYRNYYKGHMDKIKGGGWKWGRDGGFGWGGMEGWGEKPHNFN